MDLSTVELKFLLRLLKHSPDYRTSIQNAKPNDKTKASDRDRICRSLCSKGLVEYSYNIAQYRTEPAGKSLLKQDISKLPVIPDDLENELKLLKAAKEKTATPGQASGVSASDRQRLLRQLETKGLIQVVKQPIKEVWLTQQGKLYLRDECKPTSTSAQVQFSMLGNYLTFLRQFVADNSQFEEITAPEHSNGSLSSASAPTSNDVLDVIQQLDRQFRTDNYLPIFHLREKLQPLLSRDALDKLLDELQLSDRIELGMLQDVANYSEAELAAGIPQNFGGPLFYISVIG